MMRRDANAMAAYSDLAELNAERDPRQRFVDEITPVGRAMAEVSRGQYLLSSAGRAAPLTGGLTPALVLSPRVAGLSLQSARPRGHSEQWIGFSPASTWRIMISAEPLPHPRSVPARLHLEDEGTNRSARVTGAENPKRVIPWSSTLRAMSVSAPRCCQAVLTEWRRASGRTFD